MPPKSFVVGWRIQHWFIPVQTKKLAVHRDSRISVGKNLKENLSSGEMGGRAAGTESSLSRRGTIFSLPSESFAMQWTRIYDRAYSWILTVGPRLFFGLVVFVLGFWLIRTAKKWLNHHLLRKEVGSSVRPFLLNAIVTVLQLLLVLGFMQIVGIQMTVFTALVGAFGVAAGLALSGTLQNFTSGILILLLKPFRAGDNVIAQGQEGTVTAIQIFFTIVTTYDNRTVIIPNSKLSNEVIVNLSCENKRRLDIEMKFGFGVDFNQIRNTLDQSLLNMQGLLRDPAHRIGVSGIEPDGYKVLINAWLPPHGFVDTKMELQERLVTDLKQAGVRLPGM